jgi:phosphate transport system protein
MKESNIKRRYLSADLFSHIENLIFSMGQSAISSINLIIESIELKNIDSLKLVENIESELDQDHLEVDATCFDFIKNYKMTLEQSKYVFAFMRNAESLERIGDLCMNMSKSIRELIGKDNYKIDIIKIIQLAKNVKKLTMNSINSLASKNLFLASDSLQISTENKPIKNKIVEETYKLMIENNKESYNYMKLISLATDFIRIERLGLNIAHNTIYIFKSK